MTECPKCHMMILDAAWEVHHELNHPKQHLGNPAALEKAKRILAAKRTEQQLRTQQFKAAWNGAQ